jgi:hypothetical protein
MLVALKFKPTLGEVNARLRNAFATEILAFRLSLIARPFSTGEAFQNNYMIC